LKSAGDGAAVEMKGNRQPAAFNPRRGAESPRRAFLGHRTWRAGIGLIPFFLFSAPPVFGQTNSHSWPALAPPYGELPPTFGERYGAVVWIGICLVAAVVGFFVWKKCHPQPPPPLPPETVARRALAKWRGRPEDGKVLSDVSQVLRRYVTEAFALPPGERTTAEFCAALAGHETIGAELAQALTSFLRECDARKFSPADSCAPLQAVQRALELIELAEKSKTPPASASCPK
jgi:hypothetical protein